MWWFVAAAALKTALDLKGNREAKKAGAADAAFLAGQQLEAAARSRAIGQRQASEERRQARLVDSALQARAMGGGLDPTIQEISTDIAGEGEYRALSALYEGEMGALGLEDQANAGLRSAKARGRALDYQAAGQIVGGASSMWSKYGGGAAPKYDYNTLGQLEASR